MILEHQGVRPTIHETAYVAPTATVCGDVTIGAHSCVLFGAVIVGEGGHVEVGNHCIIREQATIRGTLRHGTTLGNHILVGPHAYLTGCTVEDNAFLATGVAIFPNARIGQRSEVRIHGVVHVNSALPPDTTVPIGWIAVGDPATIFPPGEHDRIWAVQEPLDFPGTVYGVERSSAGETNTPEITSRLAEALALHRFDRVLDQPDDA